MIETLDNAQKELNDVDKEQRLGLKEICEILAGRDEEGLAKDIFKQERHKERVRIIQTDVIPSLKDIIEKIQNNRLKMIKQDHKDE